jgi:hypothetical protein
VIAVTTVELAQKPRARGRVEVRTLGHESTTAIRLALRFNTAIRLALPFNVLGFPGRHVRELMSQNAGNHTVTRAEETFVHKDGYVLGISPTDMSDPAGIGVVDLDGSFHSELGGLEQAACYSFESNAVWSGEYRARG